MPVIRMRSILPFLFLFVMLLSGVDVCSGEENGNRALPRGRTLFEEGRYESALKEFQKAVREGPVDAEAHYYLGLTRSRLEDNEEALLSLSRAKDLNPDLPGLRLNIAIAYYRLEAFAPALTVLQEALERDPGNGAVHYFIGLALKGTGRYERSLPFIQRAMALDSGLTPSAWYHIGVAHYMAGEENEAREAFKNSIQADPGSEIAQGARDYIRVLKEGEEGRKRWRIRASTGLEYDDNLTVEEEDEVSEESDLAAVLEFEGAYLFIDRKPWEVEVSYDLYQSLYEDTSRYDLQSHRLGLSGSGDYGRWDIGLDYGYSYISLGSDGFLMTHSIAPSLGYALKPNLYLRVNCTYEDKDFVDEENDPRDAVNYSAGVDAFLFFMENLGHAQLGARHEKENTVGDEYDFTARTVTGAVQWPGPFDIRLGLGYKCRFKDYGNITPGIGVEREDTRQTYSVTLNREIRKNVEIRFDYQHIRSDSNLPSSEYTENIIFLGLSVWF